MKVFWSWNSESTGFTNGLTITMLLFIRLPCPPLRRVFQAAAAGLILFGTVQANPAQSAEYSAGAISVDMSKPKGESYAYGIGGGDTAEEAQRNAHKFCSEDGATHCKLVVTYQVCGAAAGNDAGAAGGFGTTKAEAQTMAMSKCGAAACKLIVADCN